MVRFNELDFRLCNIPPKSRECYLYVQNERTYVTFDLEYITQIASACDYIKLRKLQATNYLYVNFKKKRIINAQYKVFELLEPTEKS